MSSSSVVSLSSFNILFFTQVLTVLTSSLKYNEYVTDKGKNISIPCTADGNIMWIKENGNNSTIIQTGKLLVLTNVTASDRGVYVCFASVPPRHIADVTTNSNSSSSINSSTNDSSKSIASESPVSTDVSVVLIATILPTTQISLSPLSNTTTTTKVTTTVNTFNLENNNTIALALPANTTTSPLQADYIVNKNNNNYNTSSTLFENNKKPKQNISIDKNEEEEDIYQAVMKVNLTVRTPPGPVTQLYFKASTILGFLIWRFNKTNSGGYPLRSFTAEFRNISYNELPYNSSYEHEWSRMDPVNIAPNVRQMEVYRLAPNTTYEFRIWANNQLGSGDVVTTNVTTLPETNEEDLIRLIQPDLDNFDPRIWIIAVSVVLGTLVILAIGLCIVLTKECYQSSRTEFEDGWDGIELIPNIILNPGFCEEGQELPFTRTIIFGEDNGSDSYESEESDHEPRMEKFKRKVSVFFTGPTIKRI